MLVLVSWRGWWPASIVALTLLLVLTLRPFNGGWLDPLPWLRGARGEEAVARALRSLEYEGFRSLHDIDTGHGNIDHVVVGPSGVFMIETKNWSGKFYAQRGRLMHRGHDRTHIVKAATAAAIAVRRRLALADADRWVEAVIVSTNAAVFGSPLKFGHVTVMELANLPGFLRAHWPGRSGPLSSHEIAHCLAAIVRGDIPVTVRSLSLH